MGVTLWASLKTERPFRLYPHSLQQTLTPKALPEVTEAGQGWRLEWSEMAKEHTGSRWQSSLLLVTLDFSGCCKQHR